MRGFLASILILAVLAIHSASAVHVPCRHEQMPHHGNQPHVHVHGGHSHATHHARSHHHRHHGATGAPVAADQSEEGGSACYLPDYLLSEAGLPKFVLFRNVITQSLELCLQQICCVTSGNSSRNGQQSAVDGRVARVPLYLRSLSIRC